MDVTANYTLRWGLIHIGIDATKQERLKADGSKESQFYAHYGVQAEVVTLQWHDLCSDMNAAETIPPNERNASGFKMFLVAHFYLWNKPRNAKVLASRFGIAESRAQGKSLWRWIERIASLKVLKIVWDEALDDPDNEIFVVTLDGTDFKTREEAHDQFPVDTKMSSFKMKHAAWRYDIAVAVFRERIVFASGPEKASLHDLNLFRKNGLKEKMLQIPGKMIIADSGYKTTEPDEVGIFSIPNVCDPDVLYNFKSRARLRQEQVNSRLKDYAILRHAFDLGKDKHAACFYAVLVNVQYKIDNGAHLYRV